MTSFHTVCTAAAAAALLGAIAACGGGNNTASSTPTPSPGGAAGATTVYVIQNPIVFGSAAGMVLQFPASASGSVAPSGAALNGPTNASLGGVTTDGTGNLYVNYSAPSGSSGIAEYSAGATGTVTPVRNLPANATTGVTAVDGLATSASGEIFVGEDYGGLQAFSATATGSVAPSRRILGAYETGGGLSTVGVADAVAVDSADNLYVVNQGSPGGLPLVVFGPTASGNVAPLYGIGGSATGVSTGGLTGITTDSSGNVYVTLEALVGSGANLTYNGSILEFAAGSKGNVAPIRTITGSSTALHFLAGIKVDSVGNIFVVSSTPGGPGTALNPTVLKFAAAASGNVAPTSSFTSTAWTNPDNGGSIALR